MENTYGTDGNSPHAGMQGSEFELTPPLPLSDSAFYALKAGKYVGDGLPNVMADAFEDTIREIFQPDDHDLIREVFAHAEDAMELSDALELFDEVIVDTWSRPCSVWLERCAQISEYLHRPGQSAAAVEIRKDLAEIRADEQQREQVRKEEMEREAQRQRERRQAQREEKALGLLAKMPGVMNQAFADWLSGRAYIDNNGNYHIRKILAGMYGHIKGSKGPIAPWNKTVKKAFKDSGELHDAAAVELRKLMPPDPDSPSPEVR